MNRFRWICLSFLILAGCGGPPITPVTEIFASASDSPATAEESEVKTQPDDWPCWRGPNSDGIAYGPAVPTRWTASENVKWKAKIPGRGHSSPIIVGERIYLETADEKDQTQSVLCLDRADGHQIWQTRLHKGKLEWKVHEENTQASTTLACDGECLYALFLNDHHIWASALDLDGNELWKKSIGSFDSKFGFSSSPVIFRSIVLFAADHQHGGFIVGLRCKDGSVVWRKKRPAKSSYASPRVVSLGGRDQMVIGGCGLLCSFDPLTGGEIWKRKGTAEAGVGTPVVVDDIVMASGGYPESSTIAVDAKGKVVWEEKIKSYVPSMITHEGHLYIVPDDGVFHCLEVKTGKETWKKRIGGNFRVSPVLSDGNIFTTDMSGKTTVFKANPAKFELVAENKLGDEAFASPAISRGQMFVRVADSSNGPRQEWIYCIGQ
jgi:hypothetical protein